MLDLDLTINDGAVRLGMTLDEAAAARLGVRATNMVGRKLVRPAQDEQAWFIKNCMILCLGGQCRMDPMLGLGLSAAKRGSTAAYLWTQDRIVRRSTLQCVGNESSAQISAAEFREELEKTFGPPTEETEYMAQWQDDQSAVALELSDMGRNCHVHWLLIEPQ